MYVYIYISMYMCMYVCTYACMHVCFLHPDSRQSHFAHLSALASLCFKFHIHMQNNSCLLVAQNGPQTLFETSHTVPHYHVYISIYTFMHIFPKAIAKAPIFILPFWSPFSSHSISISNLSKLLHQSWIVPPITTVSPHEDWKAKKYPCTLQI